ncbi:MAG: DUF3365 domain-containing protein [Pseudomonadota bacterium]
MRAARLKARTSLLLAVALLFSLAGGAVVLLVHDQARRLALWEAQRKAQLILDRNLATHTYFSHQLKPKVFAALAPTMDKDYFEPARMSSTYAIRGIDGYFKQLNATDYYYKECAVNARNPLNEADDFERAFIGDLRADPKLDYRTAVRVLDDKPYYEVLRRGEVMEQACLRCHSRPAAAPGGMLALYGDQRSFGRQEGEVVSAISIRIPLESAFAQSQHMAWMLSGLLLAVLAVLLVTVYGLSRSLFLRPLEIIRQEAETVAGDPKHLGERIPPEFHPEWNRLAEAFNHMSFSLKASHEGLEQKVAQRTAVLEQTTRVLEAEVGQRKLAEREKEKLIVDLQRALAEVKQLSGLLPICAQCKKIRTDSGYWQQIETYITDHSGAQFSHGICPECAAELYPGLLEDSRDRPSPPAAPAPPAPAKPPKPEDGED